MQPQKLSIVIPAFNEEGSIVKLIQRLDQVLTLRSIIYEIIVIDDNSTDSTYTLAKSLSEDYAVNVYHKKGVQGKATSLLEGFGYAQYDLIAFIDADLQYPPEALPYMVYKINQGYHIVIGNRTEQESSLIRKLSSHIFHLIFVRWLHGLNYDTQSGLKVFRKEILSDLHLKPTPWTFDLEFLLQAREYGYHIGNYDITYRPRLADQSKINLLKASFEIGLNALKLKFRRIQPHAIAPQDKHSMLGAGVIHQGRRFITHTTLENHISALEPFTTWQLILIFGFFILIGLSLFYYPIILGIIFMSVLNSLYFFDAVFHLYLVIRSIKFKPEIKHSQQELAQLDAEDLPIYTILCPLYKESRVLAQFLEGIAKIDWPADKLDVILLLEADDKETLSHLRTMQLPCYVRPIIVPHSLPKTKPKACNYGLSLAKGEYLVIYDAEDVPDPMQLKKAYLGFKKSAPDVNCLQAKLNYYNPKQNILTRLFTAEYSLWFDVMLPGLQSIHTYIPLGGTSNHFRTEQLRRLKGWDPFNVTEDCDLGIRLFRRKFKTAIIDSVTLEEANSKLGNWLRQRSRWIKGYMQTYLVHMRQPLKFIRHHGLHAFIFHLIVGGKIIFALINPLMWLTTILYFSLRPILGPTIEQLFPGIVFIMGVFSLVFGNFLFFYYYMIGCARRKNWWLMRYIYLVPVYWWLISLAAYKAIYQLIVKPHYWEKTHHGLYLPVPKVAETFSSPEASPELSPEPLTPVPVLNQATDFDNFDNQNPAFNLQQDEILPTPNQLTLEEKVSFPNQLTPKEKTPAGSFSKIKNNLSQSLTQALPNIKPSVLSQAGFLSFAFLLANGFNLIFNTLLGRLLSYQTLSLVIFINSLWYLASIFLSALSATLNHQTAFISADKNETRSKPFVFKTVHQALVIAILFSGLWILLSESMLSFFNINSLTTLLLFTPIFSAGVIAAACTGFLQGKLLFKYVGVVVIIEALTKLLAALGFIWLNLEAWVYLAIPISIIISAILASGLSFLVPLYSAKHNPKKSTQPELSHTSQPAPNPSAPKPKPKKVFFSARFYLASLLAGLSALVFFSLDIVLVKHFFDPVVAGQYTLLTLAGKMVFFLGSLPYVFLLTFVSRGQGLKQDTQGILKLSLIISLVLVILSALMLGPLGFWVMPLLFGAKALAILPLLNWYLVAVALFTLAYIIVIYHLAKKNYLYPSLAFLSSLAMGLGIIFYHASLEQIIWVILAINLVNFSLVFFCHIFDLSFKFIKRTWIDFLSIFKRIPLPTSQSSEGNRILIFNWRDTVHKFAGGAENYVQQIAKQWTEYGYQVTIFCGNDGQSKRHDIIDGVHIIRRGGFYFVYLWAAVYYLLRLRKKVDIIIDCHNGIPFFTPLYSNKAIYCLMHHVHQEVFRKSLSQPLAWLASFLEKDLMPMVYKHTRFITISESSQAEIIKLGFAEPNIAIVNPGIDADYLTPGIKSSYPLILYLGRLKAYKSVDVLIRAFAKISSSIKNARLVIAGSGEEDKNLKQLAHDLKLEDKVVFAGYTSEEQKRQLLQAAWVFVNPSFIEGWGITTIEANACATPVVASDVNGLRDSVRQDQTGFLVEYGNESALAQSILTLIQDNSLRSRMMSEAVEWASNFSWKKTSDFFLNLIQPVPTYQPRPYGYLAPAILAIIFILLSLLAIPVYSLSQELNDAQKLDIVPANHLELKPSAVEQTGHGLFINSN